MERIIALIRSWLGLAAGSDSRSGARLPALGPLSTIVWLATADILVLEDRDALERLGLVEARLLVLRPALVALRDASTRPGRHATRLVEELDAACQASSGLLLHALRAIPWTTDDDARALYVRAVDRLESLVERAHSLVEARRTMHEASARLAALLSQHGTEQPYAVNVLDLAALNDAIGDTVELPLAQRTLERLDRYERLLMERSGELARQTLRVSRIVEGVPGADRERTLADTQLKSIEEARRRVSTLEPQVTASADRQLASTPKRLRRTTRGRKASHVRASRESLLNRRDALAVLIRTNAAQPADARGNDG